jgi:hypothetical protein
VAHSRRLRDDQRHHDGIAVRPLLSAVPAGDVHDRRLWLLIAVVASIDMHARAIAMGQARRQAQALGSGCRQEAVACGHPVGLDGIQGPTEGIIIALVGSHTR